MSTLEHQAGVFDGCVSHRFNMRCIAALAIQMVVLRPLLSFAAAVMWSDGVYISGYVRRKITFYFLYSCTTKRQSQFFTSFSWLLTSFLNCWQIAASNGYPYIATASLTSSLVAVWGMTLIRQAFEPMLGPHIPGLTSSGNMYERIARYELFKFISKLTLVPTKFISRQFVQFIIFHQSKIYMIICNVEILNNHY